MSGCWEVDDVPGKGYVMIHRKLWDNPIFAPGERFDRRSAWLWILTHVNHAPGSIMKNGSLIHLKRGQMFESFTYFARVWGWDRKTVCRFFGTLETEKMVTLTGHQKGHLITVVNFNKYQGSRNSDSQEGTTEGTTESPLNSPGGGTTEGATTKECIKNDKRNQKKGTRGGRVLE